MSFTTVALTGTSLLEDGSPNASGSVTLRLNTPLMNGAAQVTPNDVVAACASDGTFTLPTINALDDAGTAPSSGAYYSVYERTSTRVLLGPPFYVAVSTANAPTANLYALPRVNATGLPVTSYGVTRFNTRRGDITLTKADVTGTGLAAADVGADASGAAATEQTRAQTAEAGLAPGNPLIFDDFSGYPDGTTPVTSLSGHAYHITGTSAAACKTESGLLTLSPVSGTMTWYAQLFTGTYNTPANPITRIGSTVTFSPGTTEGAAYGINLWNGKTIPGYSCCHLTILLDHWTYGVWINGVFTIIYQKNFDNSLPLSTPLTFECVIDQPNGRAYVREPDGAIFPVADPLIRQAGPGYYATWEETTVASTDWIAGISQIWADITARPPAKSPQAEITAAAIAIGRRG